MPAPALTLLLCDCVSWRLDLFQGALERVAALLQERDELAEVTFGYRVNDDLAVLVLEPELPVEAEFGARAVAAGALPGLRQLELPAQAAMRQQVRDKALGACDLVVRHLPPESVVAQLRARLGMRDDRRASLRLAVEVPVRVDTPQGWREATARDVSASGVHVATDERPDIGERVAIEFFPDDLDPAVRGFAVVVRHTPEGFGARLVLAPPAQQSLYARLRRQPQSVPPVPRKALRVPVALEVELTSGAQVLVERTENLSLNGVFVRTEQPPAMGTSVQVELRLGGEERVRVGGEVVRVVAPGTRPEGAGCGVHFDTLAPAVRKQIELYIEESLARPAARVLLAAPAGERRQAVARLLANESCEVIEAGSGSEVFDKLIEELLRLDLLVLDASLPDTSVVDLLHRLRHLGGELDLPVAVIAESAGAAPSDAYPGLNEVLSPQLPDAQLASSLLGILRGFRSAVG